MDAMDRRRFLFRGGVGLAAVGAGALLLRQGVMPTPAAASDQDVAEADAIMAGDPPTVSPQGTWAPTEPNILGPFYTGGAPYRAKICPPKCKGETLLISGCVWGLESRKPLAGATLDIWQADHDGSYHEGDRRKPVGEQGFAYRARLITDEQGYYEYETIMPGQYKLGRTTWRPAHIHYLIRAEGHTGLITQLYFKGDRHLETDRFVRKSLIIDPETVPVGDASYLKGTFDIVLKEGKGISRD